MTGDHIQAQAAAAGHAGKRATAGAGLAGALALGPPPFLIRGRLPT